MTAFTLMRMSECPNLDALRRVWDSLSPEKRAEPEVREYKDHYKRVLQGVKP